MSLQGYSGSLLGGGQGAGGGGGGGESLAATLAIGNTTGANDIILSVAQALRSLGLLLISPVDGSDVRVLTGSPAAGPGNFEVFTQAGAAMFTLDGNSERITLRRLCDLNGRDLRGGNELNFILVDSVNGRAMELSGISDLAWAVDGSASSAKDVGLARRAAGILTVSDGSVGFTGIGAIRSSKDVEANTAVAAGPNVLTDLEAGKVLTNEGAAAENHHDLPTAVAGLRYCFIVQQVVGGLQVNAAAGDRIRIGGTQSAVAGFVSSLVIGDVLDLVAINATEWVSKGPAGSWTFDT